MNNTTPPPLRAPDEDLFSSETIRGQVNDVSSARAVSSTGDDSLNGTELFSFFTADIIRQEVLFTR